LGFNIINSIYNIAEDYSSKLDRILWVALWPDKSNGHCVPTAYDFPMLTNSKALADNSKHRLILKMNISILMLCLL